MICGLFGTVIALERAVALARPWAFLAPCAFGLGGLAIIAGSEPAVAAALFLTGAAVLVASSLTILLLQRALFTLSLFAGAGALLAGTAVWAATGDVPRAAGLWIAFFVATIAAERLELSRVVQSGRLSRVLFSLLMLTLVAGGSLGVDGPGGRALFGTALIGLSGWLFVFDVARRVVLRADPARYFATGMLAGYFWLGIAGILFLSGSDYPFAYDLQLHAVFLGFVLSMLMAHALIIFPAVSGTTLRFHRLLYLPLVLLHASVASRLIGGLFEILPLRQASGPATVLSLLAFVLILIWARFRGLRYPRGELRARFGSQG